MVIGSLAITCFSPDLDTAQHGTAVAEADELVD
jgi:hypothetical protein